MIPLIQLNMLPYREEQDKQKKAQLKQLKIEFQQVQQELHELLDKEMKL